MRTFISINLDDLAKSEIGIIQQRVKNEIESLNKEFSKAIKWEAKEKFHLTLFFIGELNQQKTDEVRSRLIKLEKITDTNEMSFEANGISAFPNLKFPRVIVLKMNNPEGSVFKLSEKITESMSEIGLKSDKAFHPHITIARVRRENKINLTKLKNFPEINLKFSVNNFYLMKSELKSTGSVYEVLHRISL